MQGVGRWGDRGVQVVGLIPQLVSPCSSGRQSGPGTRSWPGDTAGPAGGQDAGGCFRAGGPPGLPPLDALGLLRQRQLAFCISLPDSSSFVSASSSRESLVPWGPLAGKGPQEKT